MSTTPITTEGRAFVAQTIRDVRAREKLGAGQLSPGAETWRDALDAFGKSICKSKGPTDAGRLFAASRERLVVAQKQRGACFINFFMRRRRSGMFELLTCEVSKHPLVPTTDGILINSYLCHLQRRGFISLSGSKVASQWHALGRLYERSSVDLYGANGIVGQLGFVGAVMRTSAKHYDTGIIVAFEGNILCTGVLRVSERIRFFDCLTVLPSDEPK